jgi:hypothetical protein
MNRLEAILVWFVGGTAAALVLAWIAFQLQQEGIAPAVLFPLGVGAALGGALVAIRRTLGQPAWGVAVATAVGWGLLLVVAQDYIGHGQRVRQFDAELGREHPLAMAAADELRPTLAEHVSGRVRARPVWWTLDVLLTAATAGIVTAIGSRRSRTPTVDSTTTAPAGSANLPPGS